MRSLHGEQFTRPQVSVKSNKHEHGKPDKLVESKLLGHPAKAAEGHWINSELSCPLRPPAERPGRARKFVLAVTIFIGAMVQIPVEAIPALCGSLRLKEQISEVSGHGDVDRSKRRKGKLPPLAPTLEDNDGSQVHTGGGISDCESSKVPMSGDVRAIKLDPPAVGEVTETLCTCLAGLRSDDVKRTPPPTRNCSSCSPGRLPSDSLPADLYRGCGHRRTRRGAS